MVKNGEQSITHCLGCGSQFISPQKVGDWLHCADCDETLKLSAKPSSEPKENE